MRTAMSARGGYRPPGPIQVSTGVARGLSRSRLLAPEQVLECEQFAHGRARQPREEAVEPGPDRPDPDLRPHLHHAQPGLLHQLPRVAEREPAQVRGVEDALWPPRPAPAHAELPEGLEEA